MISAHMAARLGGVARQRAFHAARIPCASAMSAAVQGRSSLGAGGARGVAGSAVVAWLRPGGSGAGLAWTGQRARGMSVAAGMVDVDGDRATVTVSARCAQVSRAPPSSLTPLSLQQLGLLRRARRDRMAGFPVCGRLERLEVQRQIVACGTAVFAHEQCAILRTADSRPLVAVSSHPRLASLATTIFFAASLGACSKLARGGPRAHLRRPAGRQLLDTLALSSLLGLTNLVRSGPPSLQSGCVG
jgi:hypothetical protein